VPESITERDNSIEITGFPAIDPANETIPEPTAVTRCPWLAGKSTPRCPGPNGEVGGSNPEIIAPRETPGSGSPHRGWSEATALGIEARRGRIPNTEITTIHGGIFMCSALPNDLPFHHDPLGIVTCGPLAL